MKYGLIQTKSKVALLNIIFETPALEAMTGLRDIPVCSFTGWCHGDTSLEPIGIQIFTTEICYILEQPI